MYHAATGDKIARIRKSTPSPISKCWSASTTIWPAISPATDRADVSQDGSSTIADSAAAAAPGRTGRDPAR